MIACSHVHPCVGLVTLCLFSHISQVSHFVNLISVDLVKALTSVEEMKSLQ